MSLDARIASLIAFSQARAMESATNATGGAIAGGADCGRDPDGKFGGGNKCAVVGGVLAPQSTEAYTGTPSFHDQDDDYVYHVTTAPNAGKILKGGFRRSPSTIKGGGYESYSKGKVFFTEKSGLATWESKIGDHLFHSHDDPPPTAIVRVKKSEVSHLLSEDVVGTKDAGAKAYYVDLGKKQSRAFCPTGDGGGIDNSCGISNSKGERIRNVRTKSDKMQTKVARKLYQMRTTEKQIKKLIRDLGGKVSNSIVEIESTRGEEGVNIFIRDRDNNETHFIHMGYYGASIYTSDKVSLDEAKRIRALAEEAFPKTIDKRLYGRGRKYNIDVVNDPTQTKTAWDGLSSKQRFKAKLDARYASLLAFAEARDCGRDEGGKFSSGNTCASGAAAAAASGAVTGGIKGAITGLLAGGPAVVKPAAAIGAATGAVKGIYDNQMRPTRVKKTIERLGMNTKQVGELVEKLGGTPESSADAKGGKLQVTIRDKEGKKTFSVEVDKKTITVYPRRATGELTSKEISRVKEIADKSTPKSISVVVKKSSSAYVSKLVRNGFTVAAGHAGDILVATYLTAPVHSVAHDAVQSIKKTFSRR